MQLIYFAIISFFLNTGISHAAEMDPYALNLPDKRSIRVSKDKWIAGQNSETFAKNFRAKTKSNREVYEQVITVFLIPLSIDRIKGRKISETEWLEIWSSFVEGTSTVQLRTNKGSYWVLSRQTFSTIELKGMNPELSEENFKKYHQLLQPDIDRTRFVVSSEF